MAQLSGFDYPFCIHTVGDGENAMYAWVNIKGTVVGAADADAIQAILQSTFAALPGVTFTQSFKYTEEQTDITAGE